MNVTETTNSTTPLADADEWSDADFENDDFGDDNDDGVDWNENDGGDWDDADNVDDPMDVTNLHSLRESLDAATLANQNNNINDTSHNNNQTSYNNDNSASSNENSNSNSNTEDRIHGALPSHTISAVKSNCIEINILSPLFNASYDLTCGTHVGIMLGIDLNELILRKLLNLEQLEVWGIDINKYKYIILRIKFDKNYLHSIDVPSINVGLANELTCNYGNTNNNNNTDNDDTIKAFQLSWTIAERCKSSIFLTNINHSNSNNNNENINNNKNEYEYKYENIREQQQQQDQQKEWNPELNYNKYMKNVPNAKIIKELMNSTKKTYIECLNALKKTKFEANAASLLLICGDNDNETKDDYDNDYNNNQFYSQFKDSITEFEYCLYKLCGVSVNRNNNTNQNSNNNATSNNNQNYGNSNDMEYSNNIYANVSDNNKITQLCEMFNVSKQVANIVLEQCGYDVSVACLMDMSILEEIEDNVARLIPPRAPLLPLNNNNNTNNNNNNNNGGVTQHNNKSEHNINNSDNNSNENEQKKQ